MTPPDRDRERDLKKIAGAPDEAIVEVLDSLGADRLEELYIESQLDPCAARLEAQQLLDRAFLYRCEPDIGGCGHTWEAPDAGDVFLECPSCKKGAGAIV